jgi:hypothetical protein
VDVREVTKQRDIGERGEGKGTKAFEAFDTKRIPSL